MSEEKAPKPRAGTVKALQALSFLPVFPDICGGCMYKSQAAIASFTRPAQWFPLDKNSFREKWEISNSTVELVLDALKQANDLTEQTACPFPDMPALKSANFNVAQAYASTDGKTGYIKLYFFTGRKKWLDVIEMNLKTRDDGVIDVFAKSVSAGIIPLGVPFAFALNIALFLFPFADHRQNYYHVRSLKDLVESNNIPVTLPPKKEKRQKI